MLGYIKIALDEGARLVTGGGRPAGVGATGYYVAPTVFADVKPTMRVWKEEIFGPVGEQPDTVITGWAPVLRLAHICAMPSRRGPFPCQPWQVRTSGLYFVPSPSLLDAGPFSR